MKKFFTKFLLANFFITILFPIIFSSFFVLFGSIENVNAGSPYNLGTTDIMQDTDDRIIGKNINPGGKTKIQSSSITTSLIPKIFKLAFYIATSLAVLSLIYGGYLMLTSLGQSGQQEKGWKVFGYSIVGLVLMLMSRAIVGIVSSLKIVKPVNGNTVNGIEYSLGNSSYIGNLPSGKIETEVVPQFIQLALQLVFVVIVGIVIYAGIMYIANEEDKKKEMGDLFINAVIGLIIILTSYVLVAGILKINFG